MPETIMPGSTSWWEKQADKGLDFGLNALNTLLITGKTSTNKEAQPTTSVMPGGNILPYAILGVIGVGIIIILAKR